MVWQLEPDWPETRLDKSTAELWKRIDPRGPLRQRQKRWMGDPCDLRVKADVYSVGFIRRPTRLFAPLDVVLVRFTNGGGERCEASGWSTRLGVFVLQVMLPYARYESRSHRDASGWSTKDTQHRNRATVALADGFGDELPDEIAQKPWFDPDVRRYAGERLRIAHSGSLLGAATGGATETSGEAGSGEGFSPRKAGR